MHYVGTRCVASRIIPAIVYLLVHTKDVLETETSIINRAGGLGKTAVKDDLLRQSLDTIIANTVWAGCQFKNVKTAGFTLASLTVTIRPTW
jgi:hypothetical protein